MLPGSCSRSACWGFAIELLHPWVGGTIGPEYTHDGFSGLLVFVGDAKALPNHWAKLFSGDALAHRFGGATLKTVVSANSNAGKVAWANSLL